MRNGDFISTLNNPLSGFVPLDDKGESYRNINQSLADRVKKWYIDPIKRLTSPHDGFAILTLLFPLYERYLRWKGLIGEADGFSEGHPVFTVVGRDLRASADDAYLFWNRYRNGLLHRAAAKAPTDTTFALVREGDRCLVRDGTHLSVNPFAIRDVVIRLVEGSRGMWKDPDYPIATEFVRYPD